MSYINETDLKPCRKSHVCSKCNNLIRMFDELIIIKESKKYICKQCYIIETSPEALVS